MTKTLPLDGSTANNEHTILNLSNMGAMAADSAMLMPAGLHQSQTPAPTVDYTQTPVTEVFGSNVFNRKTMRALLPKPVYKAVMALSRSR